MTRIRFASADGVGRITLTRPEKKNALDRDAVNELGAALAHCSTDNTVRSVLLDAEGTDFCAGADLAALATLVGAGAQAQHDDAMALGNVFVAMREMAKPVVAAVRGRALAGGAGLATACDIVLAADDAQFGYPEVRVGFVPAMVMTMLRRAAGEKQAFDLVATGRVLSAREAFEVGLVSRVVPAGTLDAAALHVARGLAASPPGALSFTKRLFYDLDGRPFREGIALGAKVNVEARATTEFKDGVRRFLEGKEKGGGTRPS
ncbi:MAG TPA: enoyl-CoA hydratase/isomerase family protein [Gemmatimonadaceae bacterium]|nr:enoyl-CoA hydratase/isomerase family protein [Gemmatimonadaceae bacterium]